MDSGTTHGGYKPKRIVVCCDGTWINSLGATVGPPSNVTRISRSLERVCSDGTVQVAMYHPGIGSRACMFDQIAGGAFGFGLDEDIRECYNFACANYIDGDSIILVGFSRGAFTARSVADLIASVGLLTTQGMDHFYAIFDDYEHMADEKRPMSQFLYENLMPYKGEKGKKKIMWENRRKEEYKQWLKTKLWTRDTYQNSQIGIRIKAVAAWDTVGSLGIPRVPIFGIRGSPRQWKFTNTHISSKVENAFQALSLDEPRGSFRPALWERLEGNEVTNLRQVWFPGSHSNVGGGWYDQQIATITLAWMCDQLTTVGVEFSHKRLDRILIDGLRYNAAHPYPYIPPSSWFMPNFIWIFLLRHRHLAPKPWASSHAICPPPLESQMVDTANCSGVDRHPGGTPQQLWTNAPPRSWALGQTRYPDSWPTLITGKIVRHPGCFMRVDPETNADIDEPLVNTNEKVHSCVRVRLACQGMGMDDRRVWPCQSLLQDDSGSGRPVWRLERDDAAQGQRTTGSQAVGRNGQPGDWVYQTEEGDGRWRWVFDEEAVVKNGVGHRVKPPVRVLPEEPMVGFWERHLLALTRGEVDVWRWAEDNSSQEAKAHSESL